MLRGKINLILIVVAILSWASSTYALRLKDVCELQGARGNFLKGMGIVTGLAGTGDKAADTIRAQEQMLRRLGVDIEGRTDLASKNVALVTVTAVIPAFAKEGTRFDVTVQSIYDSKSLEGGTLMETLLLGNDGEVYAVAQGAISVGGFNADVSGGSSVRNNHVTAGAIPMGAFVEREIPATITDGERIFYLLNRPDFGTARNIVMEIDKEFGRGTASALNPGSISITIPEEKQANLVTFISEVENISVETDVRAQIVLNERTGTIVVGGDIEIRPCFVAHGSLTIEVVAIDTVSQPAPLSEGETVEGKEESIFIEEPDAFLRPVGGGTSATDVVNGLNKLKVSPRDMISIFQLLRRIGALDAEITMM
jgi:flagellar P-ring protein precursor FlgI